jgi:hypothetical protein
MTENRSGKAQRDNPAPSKHQANVLSETLEREENSRIPKIPGMRLPPAPGSMQRNDEANQRECLAKKAKTSAWCDPMTVP